MAVFCEINIYNDICVYMCMGIREGLGILSLRRVGARLLGAPFRLHLGRSKLLSGVKTQV